MGYRSDVCLMAVLKNKAHAEEVMAVYRMELSVQKHKLEKEWRRVDMDSGAVVFIYEGEYVKWYDGFEDVQGLLHLQTVLQQFADERNMSSAWGFARVGEESSDLEYEVLLISDSEEDTDALIDIVYDNLGISRKVECSL
jgi:hypothetical protein